MNTLKILVLTSTALAAFGSVPFAQASTGTIAAREHAAMAQELQRKATAANQKVAAHEVMARAGGAPKAAPGAMTRHCEKLIAQYKAKAATYSAQAVEQQHAGEGTLTRGQHLALAEEFHAKAVAASDKVAAHEVMSRSGSPKASRQTMARHCEQLITQYEAEADGYAAKAAEHRLAAK
jgi:hypothetical protein